MRCSQLRLLFPLSCVALLVAAACSSSGDDDEPAFCNADAPCSGGYGCVDQSSYAAVVGMSCQEACGTTRCSGASCKFVDTKAPPLACPTGTRCDVSFYYGKGQPDASVSRSDPPCVPLDADADAASDAANEDAADAADAG